MDITNPSKAWLGGRCYRILNPLATTTNTTSNINYAQDDDNYLYEKAQYEDEVECAAEQEEFQVEQLNNGKFQCVFPVASSYISYLIGTKGATRKRIENETYTTLRFPGKGQSGDVVISGRDIKTVRQARIKLEMLVGQARRRQPATHFLSIPCNTPNIQESFLEFKKQVLSVCGGNRGVEESIFQQPNKLHLTLCVMVLADERERQHALDVLARCPQEVLRKHLNGEVMKVELRGVEIMNDDPGEVDVLYARVAPLTWSHSLQNMAEEVVHMFVKAGIVTKEKEGVKMHMTIMNTKFRDASGGEDTDNKQQQQQPRVTFCARQILEEFQDFEFGKMEVEEIHLSVRHTASRSGYYSASGKIPVLPF
ncbi:hypothetical protein Pmani_023012 [Petrolisthes manimaculis]|uniref:K Homology domain-containing protein n=1 Tax=Petrolisthes manimaculis TaxID=1843537 RepID=A0AAE1PD53_9EUCA|nr:hypothetical protein Pmani_023012 [Petrolisthes manimaculis]